MPTLRHLQSFHYQHIVQKAFVNALYCRVGVRRCGSGYHLSEKLAWQSWNRLFTQLSLGEGARLRDIFAATQDEPLIAVRLRRSLPSNKRRTALSMRMPRECCLHRARPGTLPQSSLRVPRRTSRLLRSVWPKSHDAGKACSPANRNRPHRHRVNRSQHARTSQCHKHLARRH